MPSRNRLFTGREELLAEMRRVLLAEDRVGLWEAGGFGKTETAIEYAYRHKEDYSKLCWVAAETESLARSSFVALAKGLEVDLTGVDQLDDQVQRVRQWFDQNTGWLMILDNVESLDYVWGLLPPEPQGHVLVTTRLRNLSGFGRSLRVSKMDAGDGALLLARRAGLIPPEGKLDDLPGEEAAAAREVATEFDGLALALAHAGAYISATTSSVKTFLARYKQLGVRLLDIPEEGHERSHATVAATYRLAATQLASESEAALELLELLSFAAPDDFPESVLQAAPEALPPKLSEAAQDPLTWDQVVLEAIRFSLMHRAERGGELTLSMHRLLQSTIRHGVSQETWAQRARSLVSLLNQSMRPGLENWTLCSRLIPHVQAAVKEPVPQSKELALLLTASDFYLSEVGRYREALPMSEQAVTIWERTLGPYHPDTATSLNNLAKLYNDMGRKSEALPLYLRALEIRETACGANHPTTALSLNNLAKLYNDLGRSEEALPLALRALQIYENIEGPEHPDTALCLNNLAGLYVDLGRGEEALPLSERALQIRENVVGAEHPDTALSLSNLAKLYYDLGRGEEALPLSERSVQIYERVLGPKHPHTAASLNNLAFLYSGLGRRQEALPLYLRALHIRESVLGPEHPETALSLFNIAAEKYGSGNREEAISLFGKARSIWEKALGPSHPWTLRAKEALERLGLDSDTAS